MGFSASGISLHENSARVTTPNHRIRLAERVWPQNLTHVGLDPDISGPRPTTYPFAFERFGPEENFGYATRPRKHQTFLGEVCPSLNLSLNFPDSVSKLFVPSIYQVLFTHLRRGLYDEGGINQTRLQIRLSLARTYSLHKPWRGFHSLPFMEEISSYLSVRCSPSNVLLD